MTSDNNENPHDNSEQNEKSRLQFNKLKNLINQNKRYGGHLEKNQKLEKLNLPNKSLVFNSVGKKHSLLLLERVKNFISKHKTKSNSLRWVTLLDSVIYMDVENALNRVKYISTELKEIKQELENIHIIGCFELEIVNLDFNSNHAKQIGLDKLDESSRNKITVLENLASRSQENPDFGNLIMPVKPKGSMVLVHIHAIVDFGKDAEYNIEEFKRLVKVNPQWNLDKTQLHIEKLFSTKTLSQNIEILCDYMTKSGNEELKYKVFYGRDNGNQTTNELDMAIYKYPFNTDDMTKYEVRKQRKAMFDEIAYENERHLTHTEIEFLNLVTYELMISSRTTTKEGYLLLI